MTDSPADLLQDHAQVLGLALLLLGEERAGAVAQDALGDDELLRVLPYVQEAAMPTQVRAALGRADVELDDVRGRLRTRLGAPDQPLTKLRRVTWGSLINVGLLAIAAFTLVGLLSDIDLATFLDALRDASWWWLALALVLAQLPRVPSAVSTMGSLQQPLPLGPLTALQFAICYVNLAIPSTAARVAINIRFFERFGVRPATAVSAGVIDSVSGFVVQITLFLLLFVASDVDLGFSTDTSRHQRPGHDRAHRPRRARRAGHRRGAHPPRCGGGSWTRPSRRRRRCGCCAHRPRCSSCSAATCCRRSCSPWPSPPAWRRSTSPCR